ncbi:MAG: hypothetical protein LBR15_02395 [Methanobrevibacter sp.]|nr:hypothetical protein [Candidatus Methanovirga australis]
MNYKYFGILIIVLFSLGVLSLAENVNAAIKVSTEYPQNGYGYRYSGDDVCVDMLLSSDISNNYQFKSYSELLVGKAKYYSNGHYYMFDTDYNNFNRGSMHNFSFDKMTHNNDYLYFDVHDGTFWSNEWSRMRIKVSTIPDNALIEINYWDRGNIRSPHIEVKIKDKYWNGENGKNLIIEY